MIMNTASDFALVDTDFREQCAKPGVVAHDPLGAGRGLAVRNDLLRIGDAQEFKNFLPCAKVDLDECIEPVSQRPDKDHAIFGRELVEDLDGQVLVDSAMNGFVLAVQLRGFTVEGLYLFGVGKQVEIRIHRHFSHGGERDAHDVAIARAAGTRNRLFQLGGNK
jgi:hypothetical protein